MKIILSLLVCAWFAVPLFAQIYSQEKITVQDEALLFVQGGGLHFATGSTLFNRGTVKLAGNWQNNANENVLVGTGKIIFFDRNTQQIIGKFPTIFSFLEINSPSVVAHQTILISQNLHFLKGNLFFQQKGILGENATLSGEKEDGYATGTLQTTRKITGQTENFGNLGVSLQSAGQNLGQTTLTRKAGEGTAVSVPFQSSINRTWEIRTEKLANQPVTLQLNWLMADNNARDLLKAQVWESEDGLVWTGIKPAQDLRSQEVSFKTQNFHYFTISGNDLRGEIQYSDIVFEESGLNNGTIPTIIKLKILGNDEFNAKIGDDLIRDNKLKISNLPANLRLEAILVSTTEIALRMVGFAEKHESVNSITNLGIQFLPEALRQGNPQYIANVNRQDLQIRFRDRSITEILGIYPNPTPDKVNLNLELAAPSKIKITLYNYQTLLQIFEDESPTLLYQTRLDLSMLPKGLYMIKVETLQNVFVQKVVKE